MITADQIYLHLIGDYVTQSNWMATQKTRNSAIAALHAVVYSLPFAFWLCSDNWQFAVILVSHWAIDRFRLARYVVYVKNFIGPRGANGRWRNCEITGYRTEVPPWMAVWLMILVDNILHIGINGLALRYL